MTDPHGPTDPLESCMLLRASDLAGWMRRHRQDVRVAEGVSLNGMPCTVIIAIGDASGVTAEVGRRLIEKLRAQQSDDERRAQQN